MVHDPYEWILVVPCNLGPGERAFVEDLAVGRTVRVRVMDRAELDDRMAAHCDLVDFYTRDQLLEAAKIFNRERDVLLDAEHDLTERVAALGTVVDGIDDHWTMDFSRVGNTVVRTLRGKHPRAHEVSPITLQLTGRSDSMPPELSAAMSGAVGFGVAERIVLPPSAVESLTIDGPPWLARTLTNVEVRWIPAGPLPGAGLPAELAFHDTAGAVTASYTGRVKNLGSGSSGHSYDIDINGAHLQVLLSHDEDLSGTLHFSFSQKDAPSQALKQLKLWRRVRAGGLFALTIDAQSSVHGELTAEEDVHDEDLEQWRLYAEDLQAVQEFCEQELPLPDEICGRERIMLRVARLVLDGRCVISPFHRSRRIALTGRDDEIVRAVLSGKPQAFALIDAPFSVAIAGRRLDLGPVCGYHPRVAAAEGRLEALAALEVGRAEGARVVLRPVGGEHYRLYLASGDRDRPLVPTALGLPGYPEPA